MSFSSEVKEELSRQTGGGRHCQIAELIALFLLQDRTAGRNGTDRRQSDGGETVLMDTENAFVADRTFRLIHRCFREPVRLERQDGGNGRKTSRFRILAGKDQADALMQALHLEEFREGIWIHQVPLQRGCCRRAFLRGCFLSSGGITDPDRSYQFEILCGTSYQAEQVSVLLDVLGIRPGTFQRRNYFVVYVKDSEEIGSLLGLMDARVSLLNYENIRVVREVRGKVNRRVNCETANIEKTAGAAARQIEDILYINRTIGLSTLSNGLDEIAEVRLQYPTATLQELGTYLDPPVGKSGVNHRLRKLSAIADRLRETHEEET